jgi:AraC-like DNA-binding protein
MGKRKPRRAGASWFTPQVDRQRLERVIEMYLEDCYEARSGARIKELAHNIGVTRPHVSAVLRRVFGKPAREVLWERQVAYAERLLADTTLSLSEIALAAGFGTERTFYRVFRAHRGMTPGEYRDHLTNCQ